MAPAEHMAPSSPLLEFDEALARLLKAATPLAARDGRAPTEFVDTFEADGRIAAEDVVATIDVPRLDNSQMDGYAVRAAEWGPGRVFAVSQRIAAGQVGQPLAEGTAARIFTGAPIPPGADAIVMQEEALIPDQAGRGNGVNGAEAAETVVFARQPEPGEWIRRTGEDIVAGHVILARGQRLTPQACGLAASVGIASLKVWRRPRVACFFTGDELTMPGQPLAPGAIYNSNRYFLTALLRRLGAEVEDLGIVGDTLEGTRAALRRAAASADLIITSGGVSVGEEDHVRPAVEAEGRLAMWRLAIKPGRPLAYGQVGGDPARGGAHFIGLPGNPVSSFVTFLILVRPFLLSLAGAAEVLPVTLPMTAGFDWPRPDRRREFLRVSVDPVTGRLGRFPNQGSAVLTSAVASDGLVDNPAGQPIAPGDVVRYLPFSSLLN